MAEDHERPLCLWRSLHEGRVLYCWESGTIDSGSGSGICKQNSQTTAPVGCIRQRRYSQTTVFIAQFGVRLAIRRKPSIVCRNLCMLCPVTVSYGRRKRCRVERCAYAACELSPTRCRTLASDSPRTLLPSPQSLRSQICLPWKPYDPLITGCRLSGIEKREEDSVDCETSCRGFWHGLVFEVAEGLFWYGNLDVAYTDLVVPAVIRQRPTQQSSEW